MFMFNEEEGEYQAQINGIDFACEELQDEYEAWAARIADCYESRLPEIAEFMMEDITQIYGDISQEELIQALGTPLIHLDMGTLTYLEHTLDDEHIIQMEFDGDLDEFFYLNIDG